MPRNTPKDGALSRAEEGGATGPNTTAALGQAIDATVDGLPALVSYWDSDMRNRAANGAFVEFFGSTPEQIRGRHVSEVLGPQLYAVNRPHIERVLAGEPQLFERMITDQSGTPRHTQVSYMPYVLDGAVRGFFVLVTDIGARRAGEQARAVAEARFRDLVELAPDAIVLVNAGGGIVLANAETEKLFGYTRAELLGMPVESLLSDGIGDLHGYLRQEYFAAPEARAQGELSSASALRRDGTRVPVEIRLGPLPGPEGTLACASIRDLSVRSELEKANQWLRAVVQSSDDAIVATDLQGTIVSWNRGAERLYGYSAEEAIGKPATIVASPDEPGDQTRVLTRVQSGEHLQHYDGVRRRKDGRRVEISATVSPIYDPRGHLVGQAAVARDVTEQNRAEENFRVVLESAPDAIVLVNTAGEIVLVNAQTERLFGYAREELLGQRLETLVPDRFRDRHADHRSVYRTDPGTRAMGAGLELFAQRKDGSEFPVEISLSPLKADDGTLVSSAIRDITTRKQAEAERRLVEDELRHSRERLAEAERVARIGSWEWHLAEDHIIWSAGLFQLYGLTPDTFDASLEGANQRVYPDDRTLVTQTLESAIAQRSIFTLEFRAIRADGRVRTFRSHGEVVVDEKGEPIRVVGIVQDITEAKLAQEALQNTSADLERRANELQQLALRTATEAPAIPHAPLSARQLEILRMIAQGLTNAAIAERLVVTEGTIKFHVRKILAKTNSTNRTEAVARVLGTPR
jgi:PAS domain S-box-containing protein